MTALKGLMKLAGAPAAARLPVRLWQERLGAEVVSPLVRAGVLREKGRAGFWPCPGGGRACARRVVENPLSETHPLVAVCDNEDGHDCASIELTEADAAELVLSIDGLIRQLRQVLRISEEYDRADVGFPEAQLIGQERGRDAFLALMPGLPGFEAWISSLGRALVVVPSASAVSPAHRRRFGPGCSVELRAIDDWVDLSEDGHRWVPRTQPGSLNVGEPPRPRYSANTLPVCGVIDQTGQRELSRADYEALAAESSSLELYLDATVTVEGGGHRGSRRMLDGSIEQVVLTKHETAAIIELVSTGRALRAGDFKTVTVNAVDKVVERARRKLDVRLGRYEWRAIHTLAGATPEAKRWQFRGEGVRRWAVVVPINGEDLLNR